MVVCYTIFEAIDISGKYSNMINVLIRLVYYAPWLFLEMFKSAIAVSKIAWSRKILVSPQICDIKTIQKSCVGQVLYANSITLTPGTITVSLDEDNLLVHGLTVQCIADLRSGKMDQKIAKVFK